MEFASFGYKQLKNLGKITVCKNNEKQYINFNGHPIKTAYIVIKIGGHFSFIKMTFRI